MSMELSTSFIVMDTKLFTKHQNLKIVCETLLHPNLLTDWHDALVGISPRAIEPIPQIVIVVEVSGHFSCPEFIPSLSHR